MTAVATPAPNELVTSEKAIWFRIVSDLEAELSAVRSQLDARDDTIKELTAKLDTQKALREESEKKSEKLAAELKQAKEGNDRSSSTASSTASGVPAGLAASRSHEIEAWMDMCSTLALSKPTFSGSGALHQSTLRAVLEAVRQTKAREAQRGVEVEQLKKKLQQANSNAGSRARSEDGESLPPGWKDDDSDASESAAGGNSSGRRVSPGFSGGSNVAAGRQFRTAKAAAELALVRWAEAMAELALSSTADKLDMLFKSVVLNMGEPRWRGPRAPDGARWVGTWDSVLPPGEANLSATRPQQSESPPRTLQQQNEQLLQLMQQMLKQQQSGASSSPSAGLGSDQLQQQQQQRELLQLQIQQQLAAQNQLQQQQQQQQQQQRGSFYSAGNTAGPPQQQHGGQRRNPSPTSWRRVLDSHLQHSPQRQNYPAAAAASLHPMNYNNNNFGNNSSSNNNTLLRGGIGTSNRLVSPSRGGLAHSSHNHQQYYNQQQQQQQLVSNSARGSPVRNHQSPPVLGNSASIRQILERMQLERMTFQRSRSNSPGAGLQQDGLEPYRFVSKAIRRSQSPPTRDGVITDHHYHFQAQQATGASPAKMVPIPAPYNGGGGGSLTNRNRPLSAARTGFLR